MIRRRIASGYRKLLFRLKLFDQSFILISAILIGLTAGYMAVGFRYLIQFFQQVFWGSTDFLSAINSSHWLQVLSIPALGSVLVVGLFYRWAKEVRGHGVPEVMEAVARNNGAIRVRTVILKAMASAISIASGASVGRVGPTVSIGSAFGSAFGQFFQVSTKRMTTFVGCGAAAGIAATFNAPIAGAIFASEVIIGDFSVAAIGPIIVASVFGTIVTRSMLGNYPEFVPEEYILQSPIEILFYIVLGLLAGAAGWLYIKSIYSTEDLFQKWKVHPVVKALVGGLGLGIMAFILPESLGMGYESMDEMLMGNIPLIMALVLVFGKIIATSLSLGFGASGGVFAPSLFVGAMLGGALGNGLNILFPGIVAPPGAYALVGMAALLSATTHAPITAILIIFEMTSDYYVVLPLMIASIIAMSITSHWLDGNIYTMKLLRRGVNLQGGKDINVLNQLSVEQLKHQMVETVQEQDSLTHLIEKMSSSEQSVYYVLDRQKILVGIITFGMVKQFMNRNTEIPLDTTVKDIALTEFPTISHETPVEEIMRTMLDHELRSLPVVNLAGELTGHIHRRDILREYQELLLHTQETAHMAASLKYVHSHYHERLEVIPGFVMARINAPSRFVNHTIKGIDVRNKYEVDILIIRKAKHGELVDKMPTPGMVIRPGDQLILFGKTDAVKRVCEMI